MKINHPYRDPQGFKPALPTYTTHDNGLYPLYDDPKWLSGWVKVDDGFYRRCTDHRIINRGEAEGWAYLMHKLLLLQGPPVQHVLLPAIIRHLNTPCQGCPIHHSSCHHRATGGQWGPRSGPFA